MRVIIVGNGVAANAFAVALHEYGAEADILCLSAERHPSYDPCSLPYYVSGHIAEKDMFRPPRLHNNVVKLDVRYGDPVLELRPSARTVRTREGKEYPYDWLILAHGGQSFTLPVPGVTLPGVFGCKQMDEALALHGHPGRRAVVVGSGAIGVEAAEALKLKGYESVTIVELLPTIVPTMFDEPAARLLQAGLEQEGIQVLCKEKVQAIEGNSACEAVVTDKRRIPCDTVVLAVGVVAGRALGETGALRVNRGIVVDRHMRTSVPHILACGDCAESVDALTGEPCLYQLKHNAIEQARVAASTVLGREMEYRGAYPFARIHFFGTHSGSFGQTWRLLQDKTKAEILDRVTPQGYLRLILKDDCIVGGQAVGEVARYLGLLIGAMWRGDRVSRLREQWDAICALQTPWPPMYRTLGRLLGFPML